MTPIQLHVDKSFAQTT